MAKQKQRKARVLPVIIAPGTEIQEVVLLNNLLSSSEAFRNFYEQERHKIKYPIRWVYDPRKLPQGVNYSNVTNVEKGLITITLTKHPIPLEDDTRIAEEILHSVLDTEGYPSVMTTKGTPANLGPILNNVFHDPIIYLRLINDYDFELCTKNKIDLKDTQRQLRKHSSAPPSGSLDRVAWLFNYAGNVLEFEVTCGETNRDLNIFRQWFAPRFPEVASEGDKLLELIESTGYDTPEKLNILLNKIIEKYDLQDKLIVVQKNQSPIR